MDIQIGLKKVILSFLLIVVFMTSLNQSSITDEQQEELSVILKKASRYCEKLQQAIFHFYCHEKVSEVIERSFKYPDSRRDLKDFFEGNQQGNIHSKIEAYRQSHRTNRNYASNKRTIKNSYTYDYQIIKEKNEIREQRILIRENGKKKRIENPSLKTVLYSYKNAITPILLLSAENQKKYHYQLIGKKRIMGRKAPIISVHSISESEPNQCLAMVWLDSQDNSVIKFDVFPHAIKGYHKLLKINKEKMSDLKIKDSHYFGHLRKGIRYPTKTEISISFTSEATNRSSNPEFHKYQAPYGSVILTEVKTIINNKKYHFFDVSTITTFKD